MFIYNYWFWGIQISKNINSRRIAGLSNKTFCNFFDQQRTFLSSEGKQNLHNQRKENSILTGIQFLYASLLSWCNLILSVFAKRKFSKHEFWLVSQKFCYKTILKISYSHWHYSKNFAVSIHKHLNFLIPTNLWTVCYCFC